MIDKKTELIHAQKRGLPVNIQMIEGSWRIIDIGINNKCLCVNQQDKSITKEAYLNEIELNKNAW